MEAKKVDCQDEADGQSDDRSAEKFDASCHDALHPSHRDDGTQGHEENRDDDGGEGCGRTWQLAEASDELIVVLFGKGILFVRLLDGDVLLGDVEREEIGSQECWD